MDTVENEVDRDVGRGQNRLDRATGTHAPLGHGRHGKDVVEVGGMAGTGGDGTLRLGYRGLRMSHEDRRAAVGHNGDQRLDLRHLGRDAEDHRPGSSGGDQRLDPFGIGRTQSLRRNRAGQLEKGSLKVEAEHPGPRAGGSSGKLLQLDNILTGRQKADSRQKAGNAILRQNRRDRRHLLRSIINQVVVYAVDMEIDEAGRQKGAGSVKITFIGQVGRPPRRSDAHDAPGSDFNRRLRPEAPFENYRRPVYQEIQSHELSQNW